MIRVHAAAGKNTNSVTANCPDRMATTKSGRVPDFFRLKMFFTL
jgi:hypothetical protein